MDTSALEFGGLCAVREGVRDYGSVTSLTPEAVCTLVDRISCIIHGARETVIVSVVDVPVFNSLWPRTWHPLPFGIPQNGVHPWFHSETFSFSSDQHPNVHQILLRSIKTEAATSHPVLRDRFPEMKNLGSFPEGIALFSEHL